MKAAASAMRFDWKLLALIAGALAILVAFVMLAGASPLGALSTLIKGSLGKPAVIAGTLRETTPLLISGLAVFLALRAGLFNIGVEGQLVVGACSCAVVALRFPGPVGMVLGALAAMLAGAFWALPAALIKAYRNGHEVITTIMLNNVASLLTGALVAGPIRAPGQQSTTTSILDKATRLPNLYDHPPVTISSGLLMGIVIAAAMAYWLGRRVAGYELQAVGANPTAARFAGIDPKRVVVRAMLASGAIAGLGGAIQVLAYEGRFYADFSPGYGFDGLGIALLAGGSAFGVIPAALLFGILVKGGVSLGIAHIPKGITTVVLGLIILIAAALRYRKVKTVA
jgi:simple sugar transport system permease protein